MFVRKNRSVHIVDGSLLKFPKLTSCFHKTQQYLLKSLSIVSLRL